MPAGFRTTTNHLLSSLPVRYRTYRGLDDSGVAKIENGRLIDDLDDSISSGQDG